MDLWDNVQLGCRRSFEILYNDNFEHLFRLGLTITTSEKLVEDCIQDLFLTLWRKRNTIKINSSIKYYLFVSLRRSLMKTLKVERKFTTLDVFEISPSIQKKLTTNMFARQNSDKTLKKAIGMMSKRQQEIIYLRFYASLPHEEISQIMGITIRATHNLLSKSISFLRKVHREKFDLKSYL